MVIYFVIFTLFVFLMQLSYLLLSGLYQDGKKPSVSVDFCWGGGGEISVATTVHNRETDGVTWRQKSRESCRCINPLVPRV